jgi:hypothetical protein
MPSAKDKADKFRTWAAERLSTAGQMSAKADKARMIAMAELWLRLARLAEAENGQFGPR